MTVRETIGYILAALVLLAALGHWRERSLRSEQEVLSANITEIIKVINAHRDRLDAFEKRQKAQAE